MTSKTGETFTIGEVVTLPKLDRWSYKNGWRYEIIMFTERYHFASGIAVLVRPVPEHAAAYRGKAGKEVDLGHLGKAE